MVSFASKTSNIRALLTPDYKKHWHVGLRATHNEKRKLCAFISGIPVTIRVRNNTFSSVEINFLCIHKKLRSKRLAPLLIKEITRRCHVDGIWEAVYTAGVVIPKPVATCRYFHRPLNWLKLYETGFSPLPPGSTKEKMIKKNELPDKTHLKGLRMMEEGDVQSVATLLKEYLSKFDLAPVYSEEDVHHWFLHKGDAETRVVWTYVVEVLSLKSSHTYILGSKDQENHRLHLILFPSFNSPRKPQTRCRPRSLSLPLRNHHARHPQISVSNTIIRALPRRLDPR